MSHNSPLERFHKTLSCSRNQAFPSSLLLAEYTINKMNACKQNAYNLSFLESSHRAMPFHAETMTSAYDDIYFPSDEARNDNDGVMSLNEEEQEEIEDSEEEYEKCTLEKQFEVLEFLKFRRQGATTQDIYQATGIDLDDDDFVETSLRHNPKAYVRDLFNDDGEIIDTTYYYRSKYPHVRDRESLQREVNKNGIQRNGIEGIPLKDILDCYDDVEEDVESLVKSGEIIPFAARKSAKSPIVLFSGRGPPSLQGFPGFHHQVLVELEGTILPTENNTELWFGKSTRKKPVDPRGLVDSNDPILVGDEWHRVAKPTRTQNKRKVRATIEAPVTATSIFLDTAMSTSLQEEMQKATTVHRRPFVFRRGCTADIRREYAATRKIVPKDPGAFEKILRKEGLLASGEKFRKEPLPKTVLTPSDADSSSPRKKRPRKAELKGLVTNKFLEGTEIGQLLLKELMKRNSGV